MIKLAKQSDVDEFYHKSFLNPDIYPYLSMGQYTNRIKVTEDDWNDLIMVSEDNDSLMKINIYRSQSNGWGLAIWATSPLKAGRFIKFLDEYRRRHAPSFIQTTVHSSNEKSLRLNRKVLGQEWGVEPLGGWNSLLGKYENVHWFRKNL